MDGSAVRTTLEREEIQDLAEDVPVRDDLRELLGRSDLDAEALEHGLRELGRKHLASVYPELIHLLTHLRFEPEEARRHWRGIVRHRVSMEQRLGGDLDLRVALLDYFVSVAPRLENPRIVETSLFDRIRAAVYRDDLTGLHNYRFFNEQLAREVARSDRGNSPVSLAILDIDDFKSYNDRLGHEAGNRILAELGRLLAGSLRREDFTARFGGEEFALIFPGTPKTGARIAVEALRGKIEEHRFDGGADPAGERVTVSAGIATFPADAADAGQLRYCADQAMYEAKSGGKNRVWLFAQSSRSHARVEAALEGRFWTVTDGAHPLTTVKLSGGGLLFVSDHDAKPGALVEVELVLPPGERQVALPARVVSTEPRESGGFEIAVVVEGFDRHERSTLGRFVRAADKQTEPGDSR